MSLPQGTEQLEGVAVVGLAGRFPGAPDIDQFWKNLCNGVESVTPFSDPQLLSAGLAPDLTSQPNYVKSGILLEGFDLFDASFFGFAPREAALTDPQHRIFLECAWEAVENAGYDPDRCPSRTGIYAGAGVNNYLIFNLASHPDLLLSLSDLQRMVAIDKDYIATRVSYKLGLKGPSITIQTACSTSLVAVHLACQSLLSGECDMALAGGASIRIPQMAGYLYEEGAIPSPDGHCRAFDAAARGTVIGSGAGVVVLKRLEDAVKDGDSIHAVIRGSAINNDGAAKIGYTAPSVDGQASVIAEAQVMASVDPDEITYVETHGTGTSLGDPIEIAGLTNAFRRSTQKKQFCAIGSVKTNIGHLDAAAGVASLIKVVMALENRILPPSINFERPNPAIDFADSPFYVQQTRSEWKPESGRRVAGVSSFGIGGTNAHVVVEEAPPAEVSDEPRPRQLFPISARTPAALEKATDNLADFLEKHPETNLGDVAFTLQMGRKAFPHRRILPVGKIDDAIHLLRARNPKMVRTSKAFDGESRIVFMFPAQGAQHVNMARNLYENEPVFRENIDRCSKILEPLIETDLRKFLYPSDQDAEGASERLRQTRYTQPAMFTLDYALAQLWMAWGIMPAAMVGHSLGEYVAATIARVFELEDALTLVAERGRLMQDLPPGSMLAVHLPEHELQTWLRDGISLAAVNAPGLSVISGPGKEIERIADAFRVERVEFQLLKTSHAFHSKMMEPVVAPLADKVGQVRRNPPQIPFVSTVTGTWISAREAVNPWHWGRHARSEVRFSPAVAELIKTPGSILVEVGPGNTMTTLASLHPLQKTHCSVVNSLPHAKEGGHDWEAMLTALGSLWLSGVPVDWPRIDRSRRRRIPLPAYPFEHRRFWIDARQDFSASVTESNKEPTPEWLLDLQGQQESCGQTTSVESSTCASVTTALYSRPDLSAQYEAPKTRTEQALAKIWQSVLGIDAVGIYDDFFELGGHSLLAVTLISEVERVFGVRLPLASLIQSPTIQQFSNLVDGKQAKSLWSPLVKLSAEGSKLPLFLMHSHGGNILEYHPLAQRLGKERPLYALQARGLDGNLSVKPDIAEMASYYLKEIRSVQPHGPYYLGGFCFGGFLALEAARQLGAENEEVPLVILMNTSTKEYPQYRSGVTRGHRCVYRAAYRLGLEWSGLRAKPIRKKLAHLLARGRRIREVAHARAEVLVETLLARWGHHLVKHSMTYHLERLAAAHDAAWEAHNPKPYDGNVLLLSAMRQPLGIRKDPTLGWACLLTGNVKVREVPGHRQNMLDEPNVESLASVLKDELNTSECMKDPSRVEVSN